MSQLAMQGKVYIFWGGHKFLRNLHVDLSYVVTVTSTVEILQNFVAFLECMNFTDAMKWLINLNNPEVILF